jgi:hypothetical protein
MYALWYPVICQILHLAKSLTSEQEQNKCNL